MRGIEAALNVLGQVSKEKGEGKFASELLRKLGDCEKMKASDLSLASSLIYIVMRRRELWEKIAVTSLKNERDFSSLPGPVRDCIITGTGGLLELRRFSGGVLVNGILEQLRKKNFPKFVALVNAVLHSVNENGAAKLDIISKSPSIEDQAIWAGIPAWSLPAWLRTWQRPELNKLFNLMIQPPVASIRPSPGKSDELINALSEKYGAVPSELYKMSGALHLNETISPPELPGFKEGLFTVQSESSILVASLVKKFYKGNGLILDMCSGRGVKAGQVLQECPGVKLECWELSEGRHKSAVRELQRLGVLNRAGLKCGNALNLTPEEQPSFIMLDAPCSGSGTWNRKPESKWRMNWDKFDKIIITQKKLLDRAVRLCAPGGYVLYITCSLLKQENENVVAEVLANNTDNCVEVSRLISWNNGPFHRGRPWGIYIWPETSWLDGFYCALIMKKEA